MRIKYNGRIETLKWAEPRAGLTTYMIIVETLDGENLVFDVITKDQMEVSLDELYTRGYTDLTNFKDISDEYYDD